MSFFKRRFGRQNAGGEPAAPPALQPILQELSRPARIMDMPRRVQLCQQGLTLLQRDENPQLWAALQVVLGNSLAQNPQGDRAENIERAIAGYEQALQVRTRQAMPVEWATTMNNLALAYSDRIRGDKAENIERAIAGYEQALQVMTRQAMPVEWATTTITWRPPTLTASGATRRRTSSGPSLATSKPCR